MTVAIGIVVNPKLKTPLLATWDESYVKIRRMDEVRGRSPEHGPWPVEGTGHYDTCDPADGDEYWRSCEITGLPRVHTPQGVRTKKLGYGTSLYTALCLGAHQSHERRLRIPPRASDITGDGVSSQEGTRSDEAEKWWSSAKRLGLAREVEGEGESRTRSEVDVTSDLGDRLVGESIGEGTVTYVNDINVDLDVEGMGVADAYPWQKAESGDLVIADFILHDIALTEVRTGQSLWQRIADGEATVALVNVPALLALNVATLALDAVNLLGVLASTHGASENDLALFRTRWEEGIDPEGPGAGARMAPLAFNPGRPGSRAGREALERAMELRAATPWHDLEDLP